MTIAVMAFFVIAQHCCTHTGTIQTFYVLCMLLLSIQNRWISTSRQLSKYHNVKTGKNLTDFTFKLFDKGANAICTNCALVRPYLLITPRYMYAMCSL